MDKFGNKFNGIFVKYFEKEYVDDFMNNGVLHFSTVKSFDEAEDKDDKYLIADSLEGSVVGNLNPKKMLFKVNVNGKRIVFNGSKGITGVKYNYRDTAIDQWGILSLVYLDYNRDFEVVSENENMCKLRVKPNVIDEISILSMGGERMPVMISPMMLEDKIVAQFNSKHNPYREGLVHYYSIDVSENVSPEEYKKHPELITFQKRDKYESEREFRFVFTKPISNKGKNISFGSMNDGTAYKIVQSNGLAGLEVTFTNKK